MTKAEEYAEGKILLINKPLNWTSFDIVKKVKSKLYYKYKLEKLKVGHAGTLDPLAEGLMIICTGKATKKLNDFQDYDKEYIAKIGIGKTTPSFDLETAFNSEYPVEHVSSEMINDTLKSFLGWQEQVPPAFSAKKINGKKAYEIAREKKEVELKPVMVNFKEIKLLDFSIPFINVMIKCSKGTYIRSFARDFGQKINSGAYLAGLKRTVIGPFHLNEAINIESFEED